MCLFIKKDVNLPAILNTGHVTGGHYWNDHTGTLSLGEVTATHLKIRAMSWYKDGLSRYGNFPYKYKTVFYLPNENPILVRRHVYIETASWARLNIKTIFSRYGDSHLQHGNPYTGKMASLYWDGPLVSVDEIYDTMSADDLDPDPI